MPTGHDGGPSNPKMMEILRAPAARFSFNFHMGTMHKSNQMLVCVLGNGLEDGAYLSSGKNASVAMWPRLSYHFFYYFGPHVSFGV